MQGSHVIKLIYISVRMQYPNQKCSCNPITLSLPKSTSRVDIRKCIRFSENPTPMSKWTVRFTTRYNYHKAGLKEVKEINRHLVPQCSSCIAPLNHVNVIAFTIIRMAHKPGAPNWVHTVSVSWKKTIRQRKATIHISTSPYKHD